MVVWFQKVTHWVPQVIQVYIFFLQWFLRSDDWTWYDNLILTRLTVLSMFLKIVKSLCRGSTGIHECNIYGFLRKWLTFWGAVLLSVYFMNRGSCTLDFFVISYVIYRLLLISLHLWAQKRRLFSSFHLIN